LSAYSRALSSMSDGNASFLFSPSIISIDTGKTFSVDVVLDTDNTSMLAAELDITYSSDQIELVDIQGENLYDTYAGERIDNTNGTAGISGLVSADESFLLVRVHCCLFNLVIFKNAMKQHEAVLCRI